MIVPCILGRLHGQTQDIPDEWVVSGVPSEFSEYVLNRYKLGRRIVFAYVRNGVPESTIIKELMIWEALKGPLA